MNAPAKLAMTENQLQYACVEYLHNCALPDILYCHTPNEGIRSKGQNIHQYRMGLLAGWPDFQILREGKIHFIEFKVGNRKLTDKQEAVRLRIKAQGLPYQVVRTPEEFILAIKIWGMVR